MPNSDRYYTPQNSKDAMRQIEKLFNKYKDAPLTQELVDYHQNLVNRLNTDILAAAKQENVPARIESINTMIAAMERWLKVRLAGNPYNGKMKNFKFVSDESLPKFKRHVHKMNGGSTHRSSRH